MSAHTSYESVMARKDDIMRASVGIDYGRYATGRLSFDYEGLLADTGYDLPTIRRIQAQTAVGNTPLVELTNITRLARAIASPGKGARIFVKDEAANPSGSFKDRRASLSVHEAGARGYAGVAAATSGNYGAAVASQAAKAGLRCIIVQEAFDSAGIAQPEIAEKTRACEAYGAEVVRLSVGPELFYVFLRVLEETGYFNASLYTPYSILGIETLGYEIAREIEERTGGFPDAVLTTHAGGGNVTGTARGLLAAGATHTKMIAVSVDLSGLHMASDGDFNRKSFTTGHTGFSLPFTTWPDRADVPRNAARALNAVGYSPIVPEHYTLADRDFILDIVQAKRALDWAPRHDNVAMLCEAYDWYVAKAQQPVAVALHFLEQIALSGLIVRGLAGVAGLIGIGLRSLHVGNLHVYVYWFIGGLALFWVLACGIF